MSAEPRNSVPENESKNPTRAQDTEDGASVEADASKSGTIRRPAEEITADGSGSDAPGDDDNRYDAG